MAALSLALALLAATPGLPNPRGYVYSQPSLNSLAFFEFAPTSGAGMTAACACTTPTGAKGEAMTFTRTGAATCSKQGLATTGINDGDLVVCGNNNEPRVEPSGGVLGLRVESARTNSTLRSQELNNAAWAVSAFGAANPTITANAAVAPDGTTTAEQVDFPSVTGANYSVVYQGHTGTAASWSHSIYAKGVSGSGTIYLMSTPGGTYNSVACAFVSTSWTRCSFTGTETAATWYTQIGFDLRDAAQSGQGAQSVYLWGAQGEAGAYATSYIPTVAAAATRNAEAPYFAPLNGVAVGSVAATMQSAGFLSDATPVSVSTDGDNRLMAYFPSAGATSALGNFSRLVATNRTFSTGSVTATNTTRVAVYYPTSTEHGACIDGTCAIGAVSAYTQLTGTAATRVYIGAYLSAGFEINGIITRVCVDPSPTRCR